MNPYLWCVVGAVVGWLGGMVISNGANAVRVENMLVGVFGAFIGGDFVASQLNGGVVNDKDFKIGSLGLAIAGAIVMLVVLKLMRTAVGPLLHGKSKAKRR